MLFNLFQSPGGKWNLANSGHELAVTLTANSFKDGRPISFWPNEPEAEAKSSCFVKEACGPLVTWIWPLLLTFVIYPHFGVFSESLPAVPGVSSFQAILALVGLVSHSLLAVTPLHGFVLTTLLAQTTIPATSSTFYKVLKSLIHLKSLPGLLYLWVVHLFCSLHLMWVVFPEENPTPIWPMTCWISTS